MNNNIIDNRTKGEWKLSITPYSREYLNHILCDNYETKTVTEICRMFNLLDGKNNEEKWMEAEANAAFIVKACNEYDKLVSQVEKGKEWFDLYKEGDSKFIEIAEKAAELKIQNKLLLEALKGVSSLLEFCINATPTGAVRNLLTDANTISLDAVNKCEPLT